MPIELLIISEIFKGLSVNRGFTDNPPIQSGGFNRQPIST